MALGLMEILPQQLLHKVKMVVMECLVHLLMVVVAEVELEELVETHLLQEQVMVVMAQHLQ
tara:strand:- start:204 stop:386 length:183 start_codon:yes stop_codon:yes gene_type:complete